MAALRFDHPWLSDAFVDESRRRGERENGKEHHYVPQFYLKKWAVEGVVQPVLVDGPAVPPAQPPKAVAKSTNFYSLPPVNSPMDAPLRWIETHLSRIEDETAHKLAQLETCALGVVTDENLKRDLAVFLGIQLSRTPSSREYTLCLIKGPLAAKREFYRRAAPHVTDADFEAMVARTETDTKREALNLMFADVRNTSAGSLFRREWAVYETTGPIISCDDPVVLVAGGGAPRAMSLGVTFSSVVFYPLGPNRLLVMFARPGQARGGYVLDEFETLSVNREIVAAAYRMTFERPGDDIAAHLQVPRHEHPELKDEAISALSDDEALTLLLRKATPRNRWAETDDPPAWPVPRWY